MSDAEPTKPSKQERREQRRRAARRRLWLRRGRRMGVATAVLAVPILWAIDRSGPQEMVDAEVTETRRQRHVTQGQKPHSHTVATILIEGLNETELDRADGYQRGQRIPVWIRRGRVSSWPYFLDLAKPEEVESRRSDEDAPEDF